MKSAPLPSENAHAIAYPNIIRDNIVLPQPTRYKGYQLSTAAVAKLNRQNGRTLT
jgi:hypothetical protein